MKISNIKIQKVLNGDQNFWRKKKKGIRKIKMFLPRKPGEGVSIHFSPSCCFNARTDSNDR